MPTTVPGSGDGTPVPAPPSPPAPSGTSQEVQLYVLLIILLVAYCIPIFLVTMATAWQIWQHPDHRIGTDIVGLLQTVASDQSRYAGSIKNLLVPVASAITAANYKAIDLRRWGLFLFLIPLAGVFACVANALMFDVGVDTAILGDDMKKAIGLISSMFIETATTLSAYVMMLVGLKAAK